MARPLRIERVGAWYHMTGRGNERRDIFLDDRDRLHFCELLGQVVERFRVRMQAFVLMDNHYHLILELTELNLSRAGQWLNGSYVSWFNRRHGRCGHLFQGRFKAVIVSPQEWGLELSRYVHLNPVRIAALSLGKSDRQGMAAGVSSKPSPDVVRERIARLRAYRWSSYRSYIGLSRKPDWLSCEAILELGGGRKGERSRNYRDYVESAVREGLDRTPWEALTEQVVLGGEEFIGSLRASVKGNTREQRGTKRLGGGRPDLKTVIGNVERVKGEKWLVFPDRYGDVGREIVLYLGRRACGLKLGELADAVGIENYKAAAAAIQRYEKRLKKDPSELAMLKQVCQLSKIEM